MAGVWWPVFGVNIASHQPPVISHLRREVCMAGFEPSEEQKLIRHTIAEFAREQIRPLAHDADESGEIPPDLVQQGWELGLVQSAIPQEHNGFGEARSIVTETLILEELAWGDLSIALHLLTPRLVAFPVMEMGTPEQKQRILPGYTGERFRAGSSALTEPRFDFDVTELQTTARADGDGFVLSGRKCFAPLADESDHLLVYARNGDGSASAFLVERGAPGLQVVEREKNMGIKALATHEIRLDDCRVPGAARLGGDAGCNYARLLNYSRVGLAALAVGVARAAFEYARDYAKDRHAFGVAIARKQAIAFMLAEMAIEIDAARLLTWEAAWRLDRGEDATRESYLAKNYAANMALKVTDNALQVLGGHGYIREHPVELWLRNARGFAAFDGLVTV
jgi:alkylation response protein AidB-like acyl-CoA dehydrogenase